MTEASVCFFCGLLLDVATCEMGDAGNGEGGLCNVKLPVKNLDGPKQRAMLFSFSGPLRHLLLWPSVLAVRFIVMVMFFAMNMDLTRSLSVSLSSTVVKIFNSSVTFVHSSPLTFRPTTRCRGAPTLAQVGSACRPFVWSGTAAVALGTSVSTRQATPLHPEI